MLQDLVQPQTLPEASLQLPLPSFSPFPPSLSFLSSLPPKAGVPGGGTCQSLAVPLRLPAQGAAPPGSQVFGSLETPPAPGEAVGLRTLQTLLQSHGEYIWKGSGGAPPRWGREEQVLGAKQRRGLGNGDELRREEGAKEGSRDQGGSAALDSACSKHPVSWL